MIPTRAQKFWDTLYAALMASGSIERAVASVRQSLYDGDWSAVAFFADPATLDPLGPPQPDLQ